MKNYFILFYYFDLRFSIRYVMDEKIRVEKLKKRAERERQVKLIL